MRRSTIYLLYVPDSTYIIYVIFFSFCEKNTSITTPLRASVMFTYKIPHQQFLLMLPKSFFKKLFLGTELGRNLEKMSQAKVIPDGLKTSECERNLNFCPPISYVPDKDIVQDSAAAKHPAVKIKLPGNLEWAVPIWMTCTQEAFLIHVQNSLNAIKKKVWSNVTT